MRKRTIMNILLSAVILVSISCGKKIGMKGISVDIGLKPAQLTDSLFVTMDYSYNIGSDFAKLPKNYKIFTHLWRSAKKEMLLVDDHMPEKPTTEWKTGDTSRYSRTFFIPQFLDEFDIDFAGYEEIRLSVGFYNPDNPKEKSIPLFEKKLRIEPFSTNAPEIVYHTGWEELETDMQTTDPFMKSWRWTNQTAVCVVDNKRVPYTFIIKAAVNKTAAPNQKITLKINDQNLDEFIPEQNFFSKEYVLTPEMMGNSEEFQLKIETDKTFVPAKIAPNSRDNRELGIQVFFLYVREKIK